MVENSLEALVGEMLRELGMRLATAESCTGGLLAHRLTNVPGSSDYYLGGVVSYANEAKLRLAGVRPETLEKHGAVSQATVLEMARGVRLALDAHIGVSISGVAGPGGGTPAKPVGTTWIGLSAPGCEQAWHFVWEGDRLHNKERSAQMALELLAEYLNSQIGVMK